MYNRFVALLTTFVVAFLTFQQGGLAAETNQWGKPVDGLQMSVALVPESGRAPIIRITVRNANDRPVLLPLGNIKSGKFNTGKVTVFVTTPQGQFKFLLSPSVVISTGQADPIAVPLVPNSSYTIERRVTELFQEYTPTNEMELLVGKSGQLWAEWDGGPPHQDSNMDASTPEDYFFLQKHLPNCPRYGAPNPSLTHCWESKMSSNKLQLPQ